jgi:4-hydroxy-tetrahydrodipicolinate synthase
VREMPKTSDPGPARGVYAAILTPRESQSTEADVAGFLEYLDRVTRAEVNGLVLFGSTGEFVHYDLDDRMRAVSLAVKRSRVPILVNVSHSSLQGAVNLAEQATGAGAAGILLMPPYFYRYQDDEIEQFYFDFLDRAGRELPVYLYNLPVFTSALSAALMEKLLRSGAFAGIKDSSGEWPSFERLLAVRREQPFQALAGSEQIYVEGLKAGADGVVSGVAAAVPELLVAIDRAFRHGDIRALERLEPRMEKFLGWIAMFPPPIAIKYVAQARGWMSAQLAVPLGPAACARMQEFQAWLAEWLPSTLQDCSEAGIVRS